MKRLILAAVAVLAATSLGYAQGTPSSKSAVSVSNTTLIAATAGTN